MKTSHKILSFVAIMLFVGLSYSLYSVNRIPLSYVSISINPDMQLVVNNSNIVREVVTLNKDADILLSDIDLVGMGIEEATERIADAAIETGFIDQYSEENAVVVTTVNEDEEARRKLEEKIMNRLNAHFESRKVYPMIVAKGLDEDLKNEADEHEISYGKMLLIERAMTLNENLSKEELLDMSIREIQQEIKEYVKKRHEVLKETFVDLRIKWQEEKQTLKEEYLSKVDELKTNIIATKEEFKNIPEEERDEAVNNYLNNMKEEIKVRMDEIKQDMREVVRDHDYPVLKNKVELIRGEIQNRIQEKRNR